MSEVEKIIEVGNGDQEDGGRLMVKAQQSRRLQKFRFYYQYPYFRLFVAYFVTICNFVIYAEDPVAHSYSKATIPAIGNAFSFVVTKYPPNGFTALKVLLWLTAIIVGVVVGKVVLHHFLFKRVFKLSMFSNDQGSWMVCFLTTILSLLIFSFIYNGFLSLDSDMAKYKLTSYIGASNHVFMRGAALGTWFGDFLTAWMVTDMMFQDSKRYPNWAQSFRVWWKKGMKRVYLFWCFAIILSVIVITAVTTHFLNWDKFNRDVIYTNELGRAVLASFILCMDFTIIMQDWDFPLFQTNLDVNLPGVNTANFKFKIPACLRREHWVIHITGKWFNYGVLFFVMLLDLNMWKNQIFYKPLDYAQYTGDDGHIFSVRDEFSLSHYKNATVFSYGWRNATIDPLTNEPYLAGDYRTNSRYRGYSLPLRSIAFLPSIFTLVIFGVLIYVFGREGTEQYEHEAFKSEGVTLTAVREVQSKDETKSDEKTNDNSGNSDSQPTKSYGSIHPAPVA